MRKVRLILITSSVLLFFLGGCGEPSSPEGLARGGLAEVCYPNDTCDEPFVCGAEGFCVEDQSGDLGDGETGGGGDGGTGDGGTGDGGDLPLPELHSQTFVAHALPLIQNASIRTPVQLTELTTDVEFYVVREMRGWTEFQNQETGNAVFFVNTNSNFPEAGWRRGPLPMGSYDLYLRNFGTSQGNGLNAYVAAKLIEAPRFDPGVATFQSYLLEMNVFLPRGLADLEMFTVKPDHLYVLRGIRGKNTVFIVAADQLPLIENQEPFAYRYIWDEGDFETAPEATLLDLEPGEYGLIIVNNSGEDRSRRSLLVLDEWERQ